MKKSNEDVLLDGILSLYRNPVEFVDVGAPTTALYEDSLARSFSWRWFG